MLLAACASSGGGAAPRRAAAERAYAAGRYAEAAAEWDRVAARADTPRDRGEARYRAATSRLRSGQHGQAREEFLRISVGDGDPHLRARAALDAARLAAPEEAEAELSALVRRHPESSAAGAAARALAATPRPGEPPAARARALVALAGQIPGTAADERLRYEAGRLLEESAALAAAREAFEDVARRFPYPRGLLWDDALFRAAEAARALGDARGALHLIARLLAARESALAQGSYERTTFARAALRRAEILRDLMGDARAARQAFREVWARYPTSRARDDAAWEAARLGVSLGDVVGACEDLGRLLRERPDSRFAGCVAVLCPTRQAPPGAECHAYLTRTPGGGGEP